MSYTPTTWSNGDTVTSEKLNKLENGVASNSTAPTFKVNFTVEGNSPNETATCDKTFAEILAAYNAGYFVYGTIGDDSFLYLDYADDSECIFSRTDYYPDTTYVVISNSWFDVTENEVTNGGGRYKLALMS